MEGRGQPEYSQSGLSSPYPTFPGASSEDSSADQASAVQYTPTQDPRGSTYSASATPSTDYAINQSTTRPLGTGSFNEYTQQHTQQRPYAAGAQGASAGGMAQPQNPSIAASPTSYTHPNQYSPYQQHPDMQQHYPNQPPTPMYPRHPDWAGQQQYATHNMPHYGHPATSGVSAPNMVSPGVQRPPTGGHPLSTVYSFVPIPGAQQHKRPRRRFEEIERMYKCGWQGCEKAYGTLNHLNAHVTMQSHGTKRTPEEFKEIRKEWKAKKKEEEAARKAEEEARLRVDGGRAAHDNNSETTVYAQPRPQVGLAGQNANQLPPIPGYQPASSAPQYSAQAGPSSEGMTQYAITPNNTYNSPNGTSGGYPPSPYGTGPSMYQPQNH